jgi:hypothetical protein
MGQEKGRRSIALAYLDADLKEMQEIKISAGEDSFPGSRSSVT